MRTFKNLTSMAVLSGLISIPTNSFASNSSIEDAEQLRTKIIYNESGIAQAQPKVTKSVVLPVSRGFDQLETCLCWSYAFFNALETIYLVQHPNSSLEISRGTMQYFNLQDRIDLKIQGAEDHLDPKKYKGCWPEGGTPLSAEYIVKNYGALPFRDYHDVISPPDYTNMYYAIFTQDKSPEEKRATADSLLPVYFGYSIPETTTVNGRELSRLDYAKQILPAGTWTTYAISKDDSDYIGKGLDPDARRNEQTHFIAKTKLIAKMNESLAHGHPILFSNDHHVVLIYGADYTKTGKIIRFYIKDSYERLGYYYKADFKKTMRELMEITVLE